MYGKYRVKNVMAGVEPLERKRYSSVFGKNESSAEILSISQERNGIRSSLSQKENRLIVIYLDNQTVFCFIINSQAQQDS